MSFIKNRLRQDAVYYAPLGADEYGNALFDDPVAVKCRWSPKNELIIAADGSEVRSRAFVIVDTDLEIGGQMALATLEQAEESGFNGTRYTILTYQKVNSLREDTGERELIARTAFLG